jgi:hypothetical protein
MIGSYSRFFGLLSTSLGRVRVLVRSCPIRQEGDWITIKWLADLPPNSIHAIVTDPPYDLIEYDTKNHKKLRAGRAGV